MERCEWVTDLEIYKNYHDTEWGVPEHNDVKLFEKLSLEGFQAGLSWLTILKKRENFRRAFCNFDPKTVANFDQNKIEELMQDCGIIRHRGKIMAVINNAKLVLKLQEEHGSFNNYIWSYVKFKTIKNKYIKSEDRPSKTELSDTISKNLKKLGFKFVGSTTVYSFMQSVGIVNDHSTNCFRYNIT